MKLTNVQKHKLTNILAIFFVSLSFVSLLVFFTFWFSGWNGKDPVNVVVTSGHKVWVLGIRPEEKRLVEISIPDNMIVPVASGKWRAGSLKRLAELENNLNPLKSAGWELLEIPIDSVIEVAGYGDGNISFIKQFRLLKNPEFVSWMNTLKLIRFMKGLNDNQFLKLNIGESMAARIVADPAGTELVELDAEALSLQLAEWFKIESLRREGLAVAVINVSGKANAGGKLARQLEHTGVRVVTVSSGEGQPGIKVKSKEILKSATAKKLSSWLQMKPVIADFDARADILILR